MPNYSCRLTEPTLSTIQGFGIEYNLNHIKIKKQIVEMQILDENMQKKKLLENRKHRE